MYENRASMYTQVIYPQVQGVRKFVTQSEQLKIQAASRLPVNYPICYMILVKLKITNSVCKLSPTNTNLKICDTCHNFSSDGGGLHIVPVCPSTNSIKYWHHWSLENKKKKSIKIFINCKYIKGKKMSLLHFLKLKTKQRKQPKQTKGDGGKNHLITLDKIEVAG